jgi:hypothetical protein
MSSVLAGPRNPGVDPDLAYFSGRQSQGGGRRLLTSSPVETLRFASFPIPYEVVTGPDGTTTTLDQFGMIYRR